MGIIMEIIVKVNGVEVVNLKNEMKEETEKIDVDKGVDSVSNYARWFDEACIGWTKDPEFNLIYLKHQQAYANDILRAKGYIFLNEIYKILGISETKAGQVVGWIYNEKHPIGDNFVDFGLKDPRNAKFINGEESTVLLDFNVDGNILDYIEG